MAKKKSVHSKASVAINPKAIAANDGRHLEKLTDLGIISVDSYVPDIEESENNFWMDYDHEQMSCLGCVPQPGAEWNAAIEEARRLHRLQMRDVNHPAWPILSDSWERAARPIFLMYDAKGNRVPEDQFWRDSLSHWEESDKKMDLVSDLTPLLQKCGAVVIRALLDGDEKLFSEIAKMIAVAFKTRSQKKGKTSNRIRLQIISVALELWGIRGKHLTLDMLWTVCVRRGITEKGMTVAAWNKMIERSQLSFLRTGTASSKFPDNWSEIRAENEMLMQPHAPIELKNPSKRNRNDNS